MAPLIEVKDKPKNIAIEKVKDKTGKLIEEMKNNEWLNSNANLLSRIGIYSVNYGSGLLSKIYKAPTEIGNSYGVIGFAALDVLAKKNTPFKRLAKTGGYLWYVGEGIYDLTLALVDQDNVWAHLGNFALDVSMAYQLGKDSGALYKKLETESKEDKKFGISKDLESIVSFFKENLKKFKKEDKPLEAGISEKDNSKSFKEYLSNFGKDVLIYTEIGVGAGYGFGKSVFEELKENYSVYKTKRKEKNELKKIRDEKIKQERAEQKIKNAGFEEVSFRKKKEILEYLRQNPNFMRKYEIENEYSKFKQKPIKEQIQIMTDKKNSFNDEFIQMKNAPWIKRFTNSSYISYNKSALKRIEKILWELDIEEKNLQPGIKKYL